MTRGWTSNSVGSMKRNSWILLMLLRGNQHEWVSETCYVWWQMVRSQMFVQGSHKILWWVCMSGDVQKLSLLTFLADELPSMPATQICAETWVSEGGNENMSWASSAYHFYMLRKNGDEGSAIDEACWKIARNEVRRTSVPWLCVEHQGLQGSLCLYIAWSCIQLVFILICKCLFYLHSVFHPNMSGMCFCSLWCLSISFPNKHVCVHALKQ